MGDLGATHDFTRLKGFKEKLSGRRTPQNTSESVLGLERYALRFGKCLLNTLLAKKVKFVCNCSNSRSWPACCS
jgi:hypothetical protein